MPKLPDNYRFKVYRGSGFLDWKSYVALQRRNKIGYWTYVDVLSIDADKLDWDWIKDAKNRLVELNLMYGVSYDF